MSTEKMTFHPESCRALANEARMALRENRIVERIRRKDHTLWKPDPDEIANRLGWLESPRSMMGRLAEIEAVVAGVRSDGYTFALLLGMGGSSLAPEVFRRVFGVARGFLDLAVLDSTDPGAVLDRTGRLDLKRTLFIVSTKSGGTVETFSFLRYFYNLMVESLGVEEAGRHFIAITDPGSALAEVASARRFRHTFLNDPEIGGRYSALSYFGLFPAALIGMDVRRLLERAVAVMEKEFSGGAAAEGEGVLLGALLGELAKRGRDKLTFAFSQDIAAFGDWIEQLIAESTGKEGKGVLPVVGEPLGPPEAYGTDRVFVALRSGGDRAGEEGLQTLAAAGHPVVDLRLVDPYDLGGQCFLWEMATVAIGWKLAINPFDQPNVEAAKVLARSMIAKYREKGSMPEETPALTEQGISVYGDVISKTPEAALSEFLSKAGPGAYVSIQAYLRPCSETDAALAQLRLRLRESFRIAVTVGYGPRFLHSTGQLHKGDAGRGLFIQLTADDSADVAIPDELGHPESSLSFGVLKSAQAFGDRQALLNAGRPVLRLDGVRSLILAFCSQNAKIKDLTPSMNRLIHEKSPYLLQHAGNPVDWYPWGDEAFDRAHREDKPVFLSVGYSTCHWCHVMAHESFEDETAAALLNEAFVCVKVDREERPDIDGIYMNVCQMMTGSGGWPLTVVMTPDKLPFFAATYIPKESRWGRQGLVELIPRIKTLWKTRRDEVENAAAQTVARLMQPRTEKGELNTEAILDGTFAELQRQYDDTHGGFGNAPKFPMPHQIVFLLRHWQRTGAPQALRMADRTLSAMRQGGIFDQLGYGFHRYSTDGQWLVPHFEKMLYDQALLTMAFIEAFQATGNPAHARTVRQVLDYCLRDLKSPEGGFFTAEDADSEGEEGRFYLWRMEEVRGILGPEEICLATAAFSLAEEGNFVDPVEPERRGDNILHLSGLPAEIAEDLGLSEEHFLKRLETARLRLLAARDTRIRPQRDDKVLTDWNGLMIAALAQGARILDEPRYLEAARRAIAFTIARMKTPDGRLLHRYCKGEAAMTANLDDYAFLIWGLIEAYEAGYNADHLRMALAFQEIVDRHFRDPDGGFFSTPDDGETLLFRPKEGHDGAIPSGNAVTLMNLIRLGRMTGELRREAEAAELGRAFAGALQQIPAAHAQWMIALERLAAPSLEVVIAGRPGSEDTNAMLAVLRGSYLPNLTVLLRPEGEETPPIAQIAPFTREMRALGGRASAYVCTGFACRRPVTDPRELAALLGVKEQ